MQGIVSATIEIVNTMLQILNFTIIFYNGETLPNILPKKKERIYSEHYRKTLGKSTNIRKTTSLRFEKEDDNRVHLSKGDFTIH